MGLGNGAMDVAMNALGVQVEQARRKPIMSFFHAFFSVGNFVGAGAVLLIATAAGPPAARSSSPLMITLAVVAAAVLVVLLRITPEAEIVSHSVDGVRTKIPRMAWLLGAMALAFGLSEGTAVDWSALHVTDVAQVDSTTGSLGLIAVSGFMVVIRLLGDRLVARFGRRNVVRFGGVCAALGYATVALVDSLPLLVAGWALVGFGVGMIAPQVYAVAGHLGGGRVLAVVVTFGYAAFLLGPAVVGTLVSQLGIQHAMIVPALLCAGIVALALTMPKRTPISSPSTSAADLLSRRRSHRDRPGRESTRRRGLAPRAAPSRTLRLVLARITSTVRGVRLSRARLGWEFDVLAALRRAGGRAGSRPGSCSRRRWSTSGTMTNRIDRLAARGLVDEKIIPTTAGRPVDVRRSAAADRRTGRPTGS